MTRALAAVAALLLGALAGCGDETVGGDEPAAVPASGEPTTDVPSDRASEEPAATSGWRTEVWQDVQVRVPAGWTVGHAPMRERGEPLSCGVGPVGSDGQDTTTPYAGRPGYGSDMCLLGDLETPAQDVLWFDSPLDTGTTTTDARTLTTADVAGMRLTVAGPAEVVDAVLASAERVAVDDNGCPPDLGDPRADWTTEGGGVPQSLSVCVYEGLGGQATRTWSATLGAEHATDFAQALDEAPDTDAACTDIGGGQSLLLRLTSDDRYGDEPLLRDAVIRMTCGVVEVQGGDTGLLRSRWVELTPELARTFATGDAAPGLLAYAYSGSFPRDVARFFATPHG